MAPAIVGPDVVDVGNVTIDDGDTRFAIGTTETVFEKSILEPKLCAGIQVAGCRDIRGW